MTAIHETAYPRIRSSLSDQELSELSTPTPRAIAFVQRATQSSVTALGLVILLKAFQWRDLPVPAVARKSLELCVLSCVMGELKSGDRATAGSQRFGDYRDQLVPWATYAHQVEAYCQRVGIASDPQQFVHALQTQLTQTIHETDAAFPENVALTIREGEPSVL